MSDLPPPSPDDHRRPAVPTPAPTPPARPQPPHGDTWEQITPNIRITSAHLATFGTVAPLGGSEWSATSSGSVTRTIPTWAIVLCVLLIWVCLLGLLFLAVKEERYTGEVTVSVRAGDGRTWSESVPVSSTSARDFLLNRVSWAQMVTSHAPTDRG